MEESAKEWEEKLLMGGPGGRKDSGKREQETGAGEQRGRKQERCRKRDGYDEEDMLHALQVHSPIKQTDRHGHSRRRQIQLHHHPGPAHGDRAEELSSALVQLSQGSELELVGW